MCGIERAAGASLRNGADDEGTGSDFEGSRREAEVVGSCKDYRRDRPDDAGLARTANEHGYSSLWDYRKRSPSPKRVPMKTVEPVLQLYRERTAIGPTVNLLTSQNERARLSTSAILVEIGRPTEARHFISAGAWRLTNITWYINGLVDRCRLMARIAPSIVECNGREEQLVAHPPSSWVDLAYTGFHEAPLEHPDLGRIRVCDRRTGQLHTTFRTVSGDPRRSQGQLPTVPCGRLPTRRWDRSGIWRSGTLPGQD